MDIARAANTWPYRRQRSTASGAGGFHGRCRTRDIPDTCLALCARIRPRKNTPSCLWCAHGTTSGWQEKLRVLKTGRARPACTIILDICKSHLCARRTLYACLQKRSGSSIKHRIKVRPPGRSCGSRSAGRTSPGILVTVSLRTHQPATLRHLHPKTKSPARGGAS